MNVQTTERQEGSTFDLAPVSMWIEDFSGVKRKFDEWRAQGVTDIRSFLREDLSRVADCSRRIRILRVNPRTLELYGARDLDDLVANLSTVFRDDMLHSHVNELAQLWDGHTSFSSMAVNYTLGGRRLDIQLRGSVMPGYEQSLGKILLTVEDVTEREDARRSELASRQYAEGIFRFSPVSLWVEDFSRIRQMLQDLRSRGIVDLRVFTDVHPEFVPQCMSEIRVVDVNQATLDMFCAPDKTTLLDRLGDVFRDNMEAHFREQLMELWNNNLFHSREVVNYALDGTERHVIMQFAVLPGHEDDWALVQVSLTDITARKKAEAYLEYLGKHDVLTTLHNRAFYMDELNRLERKRTHPVSVVVLDLNGLKRVNDQWGHDAGDALLRRMGEVLKEAAQAPCNAARTGGDEFAVVMPRATEAEAIAMVENIGRLIALNNQYYFNIPLTVAIGHATGEEGEPIESILRRADMKMYEVKRLHYSLTED
ncbi:sensor domain-containing diguanylate cyclase [Halodurantibacterium flavum]|uniref:Diguanylate cyclase domain-containing protein n=1 Tax=Halodurantibacterium flavum TaxID=1382802 RepID=A0ABW4S6Q8_9RHOB